MNWTDAREIKYHRTQEKRSEDRQQVAQDCSKNQKYSSVAGRASVDDTPRNPAKTHTADGCPVVSSTRSVKISLWFIGHEEKNMLFLKWKIHTRIEKQHHWNCCISLFSAYQWKVSYYLPLGAHTSRGDQAWNMTKAQVIAFHNPRDIYSVRYSVSRFEA